ncbi:MAG: MBG-2 domain-containing protein, partial [Rhizobacter sp.]|nr:MBG-2 domain-containing protein [Rhizobacter sp.]
GAGSGSVSVGGTLRTYGGNVDIGGGLTPATGYALSNGQTDGVMLSGALIDTRGATGRGNVAMRGETPSGGNTRGVTINNSTVIANDISISGRSSQGAGVALGGSFGAPSTLDTASGLISVRGFADGLISTGADTTGVVLENLEVALGSAGSLYVAGRSNNQSSSFGPAGVRFRNTNIVAATNSTGTITLAGEITGNAGLGGLAFFNAQSAPLTISAGTGDGGPEATSAHVVLGGSAEQGSAIDLGSGFGTDIRTTGVVNLRPLGVDTAGNLVERPGTAITIGSEATGSVFYIDSQWLSTPNGTRSGISAGGGVVVGSSAHTGLITVEDGALTQHADVSLTLQNQGTNSAGIELRSGNTLQNLGLRTTGNVTQTGAITVTGNLVVEGGAQTTVALTDTGNSIGNLAFDPPASFTLQTTGPLSIGAAGTAGYTPGTGFSPLAITNSLGGNTALIQSTGTITLNQSISMVGTNAQLNVVAPSITVAPGASVSAPAGGSAKLWASSFGGATPGTNLYGCVYGDTATCSVSGIALPTTGNQLLHPTQPTLLVTANPITGYIDLALPALTFSTAGLVNGDTAAVALAGSLASAPTGTGSFAISQGNLNSPLGYNLSFAPSTLTLRPGITRQMLQSSFQAELASDVYGRNLDQPYICTAASVLRGTLADDKQNDPLASEWGKVRNQPQLSGCLNVTDGGSCSAF